MRTRCSTPWTRQRPPSVVDRGSQRSLQLQPRPHLGDGCEETGAARLICLHRRTGEAIETLRASRLDEHLPALAHHFAQAAPGGVADRAAHYALRAGRRAVEGLAFEEAVDYFEQGLAVTEIVDDGAVPDLDGCPSGDRAGAWRTWHWFCAVSTPEAAELYVSRLQSGDGRAVQVCRRIAEAGGSTPRR